MLNQNQDGGSSRRVAETYAADPFRIYRDRSRCRPYFRLNEVVVLLLMTSTTLDANQGQVSVVKLYNAMLVSMVTDFVPRRFSRRGVG